LFIFFIVNAHLQEQISAELCSGKVALIYVNIDVLIKVDFPLLKDSLHTVNCLLVVIWSIACGRN